MLPQLRELEARYPNEIAVVGVHSGKYTAERETPRIRDASIRLAVEHPIINDRQFRLWRAYAVRAWPTLVAIDPGGSVVGMQAGEFTADGIAGFVERVIAEARATGSLVERPLHFPPDPPDIAPGLLAFPGKVAIAGRRLAIADSGHHRVLVGTLDQTGSHLRVDHAIGGPRPGYRDGTDPAFRNPQGLAFLGATLYVADSGNHAIRTISPASRETSTLVGTGQQRRSASDRAAGALSSPWDIALADDTLYVAMAGEHRLWTVRVADGAAAPLSGSGAEELFDAPHETAALAQPMGLCIADDLLYFTDAESSAVRAADRVPSGGVRTIAGTGLFDFGDEDGTGDDVRMQHPQGIARSPDGRLLVCDSYNDALKWVDPTSRRVATCVRGLHEPSGIAVGEHAIYVADTNAHRIAVVHPRSGIVQPLRIDG